MVPSRSGARSVSAGPVILWLRVRRVALLLVALVATAAVSRLLASSTVAFPVLVGTGTGGALLATFVPLLWAAALSDAFASRTWSLEARPRVAVVAMDLVLYLLAVMASALVYAGTVVVGGPAVTGMGPVLILSAVVTVVTLRRGRRSASAGAAGLVLMTTVYALDAPGARYVRVLQVDGDPWWSLGCGLVGTALTCAVLATGRVRILDPDDDGA